MVNRLLAATVACTVVAGLAATTAFAGPGVVGAGARTYVAAETFGGNAAGRGDFWNETVTATGGRAVSVYDYPRLPPPVPSGFSCPLGGCAMWYASAFGGVDVAAGRLQAYASTHILTGGNDVSTAGYSSVSGSSYLDDTITLSRAATVRLEGVVHALTDSGNSHYEWYSDPRMELIVRAMFSQEDWSNETGIRELGGFSESFWIETSGCPYPATCAAGPDVPLPGPNVISVPFAIDVELPAGESNFNAVFDADIDILVWGAQGDPHRPWHSESARIDGTSTLSLAIHVPDDVVATSGSGLLPIVGGASESTDATAPEISCAEADGTWHHDDVAISCTASDPGSGLASSDDASFTLATEVASGTETADAATGAREVCDSAGNCATAGPIGGNKVDKRAPEVSFVAPPAGWHRSDVEVPWTATDGGSGLASPAAGTLVLTGEGSAVTGAVSAADAVGNTVTASAPAVSIDRTPPSIVFTGNQGSYELGDQVSITCSAADSLSGIASATCPGASGPAYTFGVGTNTLDASATDRAGNAASASATFTVVVTLEGLAGLVEAFVDDDGLANALAAKLRAAAASRERGNEDAARGQLGAFVHHVEAQRGKAIDDAEADVLVRLAQSW